MSNFNFPFNIITNQYYKDGELILLKDTNTIIYLNNKKIKFLKNIIYRLVMS